MWLNILLLFITTGVSAFSLNRGLQVHANLPLRPTMEDGALVARTLVKRESLANVNTIQTLTRDDVSYEYPVSSMEYYAECDNDGGLYWLVVDIGSTYQHIKMGSPYSITIRAGDHALNDEVNPEYPGGIVSSPAGSPRINLKGELKDIDLEDSTTYAALEKCFISRHPDAKWWLPSNPISPHKTHFAKFEVNEIFIIGGFGDRAYIGPVDLDLYRLTVPLES